MTDPVVRPIGRVESPLTDLDAAPRQGDEGAPDCDLALADEFAPALTGLSAGAEIIVLTWLDRAARDQLVVYPRGDRTRSETGVFATRSPHRPNPIGLHTVTIVSIDGTRVRVRDLEAVDGTPVLDIKPVLGPIDQR
ncbi:tRNA (N6-threonylcarbamoyladenosine(37)-N6)-methyltransferase TrmO [Nocardia sp. NPDC058058]|uniref:tRNA (N6-threonylcarbamoyladenosine(37)-N6)-methyltransferase TrmO n=1 Tax=Nocardia sp. NPDC058058 TaxID=3346317 RepID=UPI0036DA39BA